jgi:hypothetical protein
VWSSLSPSERDRYLDFVEIAAAQHALVSMKLNDLLTTQGEELGRFSDLLGEVLSHARGIITARV